MDIKVVEEFDYMFKDTVCTHVRVWSNDRVEVQDFTDDYTMRAFVGGQIG